MNEIPHQTPTTNATPHPSLKRKPKSNQSLNSRGSGSNHGLSPGGDLGRVTHSPVLEKSQSLQAELAQPTRPLSMMVLPEANVIVNPSTGSLHRQVGILR